MLDINISTPTSIMDDLKIKYKEKRLFLQLTQEGLSHRSGVSLGSLKRFEKTGQISLESFLKLSLILDFLDDFKYIANKKQKTINSIDELLKEKEPKLPKRGKIK